MKPISYYLICIQVMLSFNLVKAQVAVSADGAHPDKSAMLDVQSADKGMLLPRMSISQRNLIKDPATGLLIFQMDSTPGLYYNSGTPDTPSWNLVGNNDGQWMTIGASLYYNDGQVGIGTQAPDNSALLDLSSSTKGLLPPRMAMEQIESITNPADGLIVYCTTDDKFYAFAAGVNYWKEILFGPGTINPPPIPCGTNVIVHHAAGDVAPVNKTVIYGTVTNIPGEISKCWITSNLGADHQASSVDDTSEASAGWYWQFDRLQGYKHNGATLTPAWSITSISEYGNWLAANDPCTHELGSGWRLPTSTEWTNIDVNNAWTNWNGPWNSQLKMHAAGFLWNSDGSLASRGISGKYWSSTPTGTNVSWLLDFGNSGCVMNYDSKALGLSVRCLRD